MYVYREYGTIMSHRIIQYTTTVSFIRGFVLTTDHVDWEIVRTKGLY